MNALSSIQDHWEIGLSSWIMQDGNYDNFATGQRIEFAVEFYSQRLQKAASSVKSANYLGSAEYDIIGEVVYLNSSAWVLDFGICAFQKSKPPTGFAVGSFVAARINLGVDPFFYFEYLHSLPNMPALIYAWKVNSIGQQTAPFIESREPSGQKILVRDATKTGYKTISKTDVWKDDEGNAEYVLNCTRLPITPQFKRTAT